MTTDGIFIRSNLLVGVRGVGLDHVVKDGVLGELDFTLLGLYESDLFQQLIVVFVFCFIL